MTGPSTPEHLEALAAGYVAGDLDTAEAEEFQQLLAANPELLTEVKLLEETLDDVLYGLNEVEPPLHLRSAILKAANVPANRYPVPNPALSWARIAGRTAGSIAALLVLALGIDNYRLRQDLRLVNNVNTMLQHSETRLFSLKSVQMADMASGSVVMDLEQQKFAIAIRNLPTPPVGHVYRLWAVTDGEKIPCGQVSASQGIVLDRLSVPSDLYDSVSGLILTLEPVQPTPDPVGPVVMKSI